MRKTLLLAVLTTLMFSCKNDREKHDNLYDFRDYIQYTTSGVVSVTDPVNIHLSKEVTKWESGEEIEEDLVDISPYINGKLYFKTPYLLTFTPSEYLRPSTEYTVKVYLDRIYDRQEDKYSTYTFQFKTKDPDFMVDTGSLHSYSKDWQYLDGVLRTADYLDLDKARTIVTAEQNGKKLPLKWEEIPYGGFRFVIDSIRRYDEDSSITLRWDGSKAGISRKGENEYTIRGKNNFSVIGVKVIQQPDQELIVNFSDPLLQSQNFNGLVRIENAGKLNFSAEGNELHIYPEPRLNGNLTTEILSGIKNTDGFKLKNAYSEVISYQMLKPEIAMIDKGVFLPNSDNLRVHFKAVNVKQVTVRVIKLFENNILQFLQQNNLDENYRIRRVGRLIAKKKITLIERPEMNPGRWQAFSVDLSKMIQSDPGAIYRVQLDFGPDDILYDCSGENAGKNYDDQSAGEEEYTEYFPDEYTEEEQNRREEAFWDNLLYSYKEQYWDWREEDNPCNRSYYNDTEVAINVIGSSLGFIVKKGENNRYNFTVTDLITAKPVSGAKINLYNFQQQKIISLTTDAQGMASYKEDKHAAFAVAYKGADRTYLKLNEGNALSMSKFDVSGYNLSKGLKGVIYGERGVWRPGDTLHLTFVLNDRNNPIPDGHPIRFELKDDRNAVVFRQLDRYKKGRFYTYHIPTGKDARTGTWQALVHVGAAVFHKSVPIATVKPNRLKIKIDFGKDDIIPAGNALNGKLDVQWLHGAPAGDLKAEVTMKLKEKKAVFDHYTRYIFNDPVRSFDTEEIQVFDGKVDAGGHSDIHADFPETSEAPGMLKAVFLTKVYEKGGDFSMDVFSKTISPFPRYVGLLPGKTNIWGEYDTDKNVSFDVLTLNEKGQPVPVENIALRVYKLNWDWWWSASEDNLARYINTEYHRVTYDKNIRTDQNGRAHFTLNIPEEEGGRYLIRLIDTEKGHATGLVTYFYDNWWKSPEGSDGQKPTMLMLSKDKDKYRPGDQMHITFPSPAGGNALISIENGSEVISQKWVKTGKAETRVTLPVTAAMAPNVYVNVTLLQPHANTLNDQPIRMYGVIPVTVENADSQLHPVIAMPDKLESGKAYHIRVSEAKGKPMTYTLAVVDEGLLDLTRFKTPDLYKEFNKRQALGVMTWDMFDQVIGAYAGKLNRVFSIGGDEEVKIEKGKKANRFKPVVSFLGPFRLDRGKKNTHTLKMPDYIGSVRVMVVAGNARSDSWGSADKSVPVRNPLMMLASAPRLLRPGEECQIPVTVFAMEEPVKDVQVSIKSSKGFQITGETSRLLHFEKPGEKILYFKVKTSDIAREEKIHLVATSGKYHAQYDVELSVINPNPVTTRIEKAELPPHGTKEISLQTFGIRGSNRLRMEIGTLPPMDFTRRMEYLITYPHGCVEQTVSSVFPQLYLNDIFDLTGEQKSEIEKNIKKGIKRLSYFQTFDGGMAYWKGQNNASDWGTSYAGHFLLEAENKGYTLPIDFKKRWIQYQKNAAAKWRKTPYEDAVLQAYRLYTLALAGVPDASAMNRLREAPWLDNNTKWILASAYAVSGRPEVARKILQTARKEFEAGENDYRSFGTPVRNRALALEAFTLIGNSDATDMAIQLSKILSSDTWLSTQTTAYCLMALSKYALKNGGKSIQADYSFNGDTSGIRTKKSAAIRSLPVQYGKNSLKLVNHGDQHLYIRIFNSGKLPVGQENTIRRNLNLEVYYTGSDGNVIHVEKLPQGTEITAHVTVTNTTYDFIPNMALTQIFPAGWEIIDTSFTGYNGNTDDRYSDIRDDRVYNYFDLPSHKSKSFEVKLNASYPGKYYLFGVQAEAMYDHHYMVRNKGKQIEVTIAK